MKSLQRREEFYKRKIFCALDTYDLILTLVKADDIIVSKHSFINPGTYIMTKDIERRFDEVDLKMKQDGETLITCQVISYANFY